MIPTDLFTALPGELPGGNDYCFQGWQRLNVDLVSRIRILLRNDVGATFWNVSAATPSADKRIYPWLNLVDGRIYNWSFTFGKWVSPRPYAFGQLIPPELGITEVQLWGLDGGDGTDPRPTLPDGSANPVYVAPTLVTGAMWRVAHSMDGRFPLGAGQIPYVDPTNPSLKVTVAQNATSDSSGVSGEYAHVLTQQEGGLGAHTHKYGVKDPARAAAAFSTGALQTVPNYPAYYIGQNSPQPEVETTADMETLPTLDATGVVPTTAAFNKMVPYMGILFIIPTIRAWYTIEG